MKSGIETYGARALALALAVSKRSAVVLVVCASAFYFFTATRLYLACIRHMNERLESAARSVVPSVMLIVNYYYLLITSE